MRSRALFFTILFLEGDQYTYPNEWRNHNRQKSPSIEPKIHMPLTFWCVFGRAKILDIQLHGAHLPMCVDAVCLVDRVMALDMVPTVWIDQVAAGVLAKMLVPTQKMRQQKSDECLPPLAFHITFRIPVNRPRFYRLSFDLWTISPVLRLASW